MSDEYTPSDKVIRGWYVKANPPFGEAEFDRWLAAHDAEIRAAAWDECLEAVWWAEDNGPHEEALRYVANNNPYRAQNVTPDGEPT